MKGHRRYQRPAVQKKHADMLRLLKARPKLSEMLRLPWSYTGHTVLANTIRKKAKKNNPSGPYCLAHAQLLTACRCDRKYIDVALEHVVFDTQCSDPRPWIQAYFDVGLTLCNLGHHRDGISYIEKSLSLETRPDQRTLIKTHLALRLNARANPQKTINFVEALASEKPEDTLVKAVLAKAYIDAGRLDEGEGVAKTLVKEHPARFGFLMAGLHFMRKDFQAAMRAFDQYPISWVLHFWLPEYDYEKAVAYYYCNQHDKCRAQALRIRRRMEWDKLYRLDAIEEAGVERVPAVDEMIASNESDNLFFDWDKSLHYSRAVLHITRLYAAEHWHVLFLVFAVLVVLLSKVTRYL